MAGVHFYRVGVQYDASMKFFISYRFTGEKPADIDALLRPVRDTLVALHHEVYVNYYDTELPPETDGTYDTYKPKDYLYHALEKMAGSDVVLVLLQSAKKSEGMLIEVGFALAKGIPVVVAAKKGVEDSYLPTVGSATFVWSEIEDLLKTIERFDFKAVDPSGF